MVAPLRSLLLGPAESGYPRYLDLLLVVALFVLTFAAYAPGVFTVSGGVVFLAFQAAVAGLAAATVLGTQHRGLLFAWLAVYAALLGQSADHYVLGISSHTLVDGVAAMLSPDGLAYLGVMALVIGTIGWSLGAFGGWVVEALRQERVDADSS